MLVEATNLTDGIFEEKVWIPLVASPVLGSINLPCFRSITSPKWEIRSAPMIGEGTSATMKFHPKSLRNPKFKSKEVEPYVGIMELFAADKLKFERLSGPRISLRG